MTDQKTAEIVNMGLESLVEDSRASEDYSKEVTELLDGKISQLEKGKRFDEAIEEILPLEKKCRQVSDAISASRLCQKIVLMCHDTMNDFQKTRDMMVILCKKRGQLRRVVSDIVALGMKWLIPLERGKERHTQLLTTLLAITDGKIFVEVERSRLVSIQAEIKEHIEKDVDGAALLLQEVQVETFSSMDKLEKARFILNQMRLMLLRKDYVRVQIASRKISDKFLEDDDMQEIKLEYLHYMVQYYLFGEGIFNDGGAKSDSKKKGEKVKGMENNNIEGLGNFYEVTRCYQKMFDTKIVKEREESEKEKSKNCGIPLPSWKEVLSNWLLYLSLTKHNEQTTTLAETTLKLSRKQLETFPSLSGLVRSLGEQKIMTWPLPFESEVKTHKIFAGKNYGSY